MRWSCAWAQRFQGTFAFIESFCEDIEFHSPDITVSDTFGSGNILFLVGQGSEAKVFNQTVASLSGQITPGARLRGPGVPDGVTIAPYPTSSTGGTGTYALVCGTATIAAALAAGAAQTAIGTVAVPNAAMGDFVQVAVPGASSAIYAAIVTAAGTVTLYASNPTAAAITPPTGEYRITGRKK